MPLDQDGGLLGEVASAPQLQALPSSRPRRCQPHAPRPTSRTVITTCKLERESAQVVLIASCAKGINYPFVGADGVGELAEGLARVLVATVVAEAKNPLVVASPAKPQMKLLALAKVNQPRARVWAALRRRWPHRDPPDIYTTTATWLLPAVERLVGVREPGVRGGGLEDAVR